MGGPPGGRASHRLRRDLPAELHQQHAGHPLRCTRRRVGFAGVERGVSGRGAAPCVATMECRHGW